MATPARLGTALFAIAGLLAALLVTTAGTAPASAQAAAHAAADRQRVYGAINCPQLPRCPSMRVTWFDQDWNYLDSRKATGGGYALRLAPGTYRLQFTDLRPAWVISKYAPTDITVVVRQRAVGANVTMRPGASVTGVARGGGKVLSGARVVAANRAEQSFTTTADQRGRFAIGGLPAGKYCLFTFDRARKHVDKCTWVGGLDFGQTKNRKVTLTQKAGNLTVFVETRDGRPAPNSTVTVTSRKTGQWWTSRVRSGKAVLRGLYPGSYTIKYDGAGVWFTATGSVRNGVVRPQRMAFGDFTLTKRGGWLVGHVVDGGGSRMVALTPAWPDGPGITLRLYDASGRQLASAESDADGRFELHGQIATQDGLTIVADPPQTSGYYMVGQLRCQFAPAEFTGYSAQAGAEWYVGQLSIPRAARQDNPDCLGTPPVVP